MSQYERWNTPKEIKRRLRNTADQRTGAGAVLFEENGNLFVDDSPYHYCVIGRTGKGKSQCCTLPFVHEIIRARESGIIIDPKDECYMDIPQEYQVFRVDLRAPRKSPTKWAPLKYPYQMFKSPDPDDQDVGASLLEDFRRGVFPDSGPDPFWTTSAGNYFKGLIYSLFEIAQESRINLESVSQMMEQSEQKFGGTTVLRSFYDTLPENSLARRNLATYATAPNETRGSIHSVAASGVEIFSRSQGLMELLSQDTLDILHLDVDRPFLLFIVLPDETSVYDSLAGLLVSQMCQHLVRIAQERGGRLPIRVNLILEELGSVGKSISNLPNLITTGRSRNLRLMLVLQSQSQLVDLYGKNAAEAILSCVGITIAFSTNDWDTLTEWSKLCGMRQTERNGQPVEEPLISQTQLAAMPTGTALIMIDGQYKFISRLPFYYQMYGSTSRPTTVFDVPKERFPIQTLNLTEYVKEKKKKQLLEMMRESSPPEKVEEDNLPFGGGSQGPFSGNLDGLAQKLETRFAQINGAQKEKEDGPCAISVLNCGQEVLAAVRAISPILDMNFKDLLRHFRHLPCRLLCRSREQAEQAVEQVRALGGLAVIHANAD